MKLLVVEDNPAVRGAIKSALANLADEIHECANCAQALAAYTARQPDFVLMDIAMKNVDGITAAPQVRAADPTASVTIFTHYGQAGLCGAAHCAGACGYLQDAFYRAELVRAQTVLRESEEQYRLLIESAKDYDVFMLDTEGKVASWNQGARPVKGWRVEEIIGRHHEMFRTIEDRAAGKPEQELEMARTQGLWEGEGWRVRSDGTRFWARVTLSPARDAAGELRGFAMVVQDVTGRKQAEDALRESQEHLRHAQKMEAVGRLAGGVAHDFNNLLTAILGQSDLLLTKVSENGPLRSGIEQIKKAGEQAAALTRQLLTFTRKRILVPKVTAPNAVVSDMEKMLRRLIGEDIELTTLLDPACPQIMADEGQVEQMVMNLVLNSRDAMPAGGKLIVETKGVYLDETYVSTHMATPPGQYVMLAVGDNGVGIDMATQQRIFEPFFTTKEIGQGTGLGLSTVLGIVKQLGGNIWLYSEVGQGTVFKIYLPVAEEWQGGTKADKVK
jgi:PAS domain S-box-containing protein